MKFIKNGIIYEPHNEFVLAQMQKAGYTVYDENAKDKKIEAPKEEKAVEETKEAVKETKEKKKKK